jgi:4-amino-4-deoxy-L-arabinose transferase-like glycosyltransferase
MVTRALYMPMYPVMLILGYLGGWYAYRAATDAAGRWRYPLVAGACLALAPEAHAVGQLFLAVPVMVALLAPTRRLAVLQTARTYVVVAVAMLPRLAVNLAEGGLDHVGTYRTDWWVTQGYVRHIQENLWGYEGINEPLGEYLRLLPGRFYSSLGAQGWLVVAGVVLGLVCARGRARVFIGAAAAFMLAAVTVEQVPSFPRYYSPVFPGMAVLAGVLVGTLAVRRHALPRVGAVACTLALVAGAGATFASVNASAETGRRRRCSGWSARSTTTVG